MGLIDEVNVEVNGSSDLPSTLSTYTTKILKPNIVGEKNILTQALISSRNTKYVIKWNFDLDGNTITVPEKCALEFDGGSLKNGTIIGQDTFVNNVGGVADIFGLGIDKQGTWREHSGGGSIDIDDALSSTSENPVQNKVVTEALNNTKKKVENAYDKIFAEHNLLNNPFFESDEGWNVNGLGNGSIEDGEVSIVGKGSVNQEYSFVARHVYMVVCFAKLEELTYGNYGSDYYSKAGIGFRVRSDETIQGAYKINIDNVSIEHCEDYVPILFVFRNTINCSAKLYFGELYDTCGIAEGSIAHAGLYDITDLYPNVTYERLYFEYKEWIENKLGKFNASRQVVYPDSIAKEAFIERMNDAAPLYGMRYSRFCNPSGLEAYLDGFNDNTTYKTTINPAKVEESTLYGINGAKYTSAGYDTYLYDVVNANTYIASNVFIRYGNRVYIITFWKGDRFIGWDPHFAQFVSSYIGYPERTDYTNETLLSVPAGVDRIGITSNTGHTPVLECYSQAVIDGTSVRVTERLGWHLKCNISTCQDLAKIVGIAGCNYKMQEILSVGAKMFAWKDSGGKDSIIATHNNTHYKDWYIILKKGGESVSDPPGSTNYAQRRFAFLAKNRIDGRCYSVAIICQNHLPNYNEVEGTTYTDEQLKELYPERYARKQANNLDNLLVSLLNYAHSYKRDEFSSFTPINGTIYSSDPENPNYNKWVVSEDHYQSALINVEDYKSGNVIIVKGDNPGRYTFLTSEPVEGELVQYADGYTTYRTFSGLVEENVPADAKYLLVNYKENDVLYAPYSIRLYAKEYDFSIIDWDACCVGEIRSDVPFAISELEENITNKTVDKYKWWLGEFYGKNTKMIFQPYSVTKLLTANVALDYLKCSDDVVMSVSDNVHGSGNSYENGEIMKVSDAVFALMSYSDNKIACALSRIAGYEILKGRKLFLIDKTVELASD